MGIGQMIGGGIWAKRRRWLLPLYLLGCCLALPCYSLLAGGGEALEEPEVRRLVLLLDGVPYETVAELRAEGCFRSFHAPARMVATFPSLTNPSIIEILNAPGSPSYEDHYYDRAQNRLVGTFQDRISGRKFIEGTYREMFDYHAPAFRGALAYLAQPLGAMIVAQADLAGFRSAFVESRSPFFVGYIGATDSLTHLGGKQRIKSLLRRLDRTIEELRSASGGRLEVEILSDHGNHYGEFRDANLNATLEAAGFIVEKSLRSERGVVFPRYGLVGSAALFTHPALRRELAEAAAGNEGVDLAAYQEPGEEGRAITIVSRRGRARVVREGARYGYEDLGGDPLALGEIVRGMRERGMIDRDGYADRDEWWEATRDHVYVDPLRRLFNGFTLYVRTFGDVLVSFEDGYLIGSPLFSIFAEIKATHGNLKRGESEGFAISTRQQLPSAVRGSDIYHLFGLHEMKHAESYLSEHGHCRIGAALARQMVTGAE